MKNVVFYSRYKKDKNSPELLKKMKVMPFAAHFFYFCIDPDPITKKRNDDLLTILEVTDVPTMYVDGEKFVGEDAFEWLAVQEYRLFGAGKQPQQTQPQQPEYDTEQYSPHGGGGGRGGFQSETCPPRGGQQPVMGGRMQPHVGGFAGMSMGQRAPQGGGGGGGAGPIGGMPPGHMGDDNGSGLAGGSGDSDSSFANPFAPSDITGINNMTPDEILTPIKTKDEGGNGRMDEALKRFSMERSALMPETQPMMMSR